jgi:hypothetical protein
MRMSSKLPVWPPGTRFKIIGYCDVFDWARDNVDDTFLREEDQFEVDADALPKAEDLIAYVRSRGYPHPTGRPRCHPLKCDPIYKVLVPE